METKIKPIWPALTLLLLAPITGEILSSSLPPLEFIQPATMLLQMMLYGCGALLIRELKVRKNLGWLAVFLLGLAYGIYEEGVVVRSFFDPLWMDLGFYGTYGRWFGVNWIWTINLSIFHAVISIMTPLMLLDLLYPSYREKSLINKGSLTAAIIAFSLMSLFGIGFGMKATFLQLLSCFVLMGVLAWIAFHLPSIHQPLQPNGKPARFYWTAFLGSFLFWLFHLFIPNVGVPAFISWWLANGLIVYYLILTRRLDRLGETFDPARKTLFAFGTLTLWFFFDMLIRFDTARADDVRGMALFAAIYFIGMVILNLKYKQKSSTQVQAINTASE